MLFIFAENTKFLLISENNICWKDLTKEKAAKNVNNALIPDITNDGMLELLFLECLHQEVAYLCGMSLKVFLLNYIQHS